MTNSSVFAMTTWASAKSEKGALVHLFQTRWQLVYWLRIPKMKLRCPQVSTGQCLGNDAANGRISSISRGKSQLSLPQHVYVHSLHSRWTTQTGCEDVRNDRATHRTVRERAGKWDERLCTCSLHCVSVLNNCQRLLRPCSQFSVISDKIANGCGATARYSGGIKNSCWDQRFFETVVSLLRWCEEVTADLIWNRTHTHAQTHTHTHTHYMHTHTDSDIHIHVRMKTRTNENVHTAHTRACASTHSGTLLSTPS